MRARLWLAAVAGASMSVLACADLLGFKELHGADAAPPDVNVPDTGIDVDTCAHARWPDPPTSNSPGAPQQYTMAVRHVYFTTTPDGGTASFGYDLDGKCTTDPASASCKAGTVTVDGVGGVDNGSIGLMSTVVGLQVTPSLTDQSMNATINTGAFTILVRVFGLQSDQNQISGVNVALQASPTLVTSPPTWDGGDRWYPSSDDVVGGPDSGTSNTPSHLIPAYVANGVLVAKDTKPPLAITLYLPPGNTPSGPLQVLLQQAVISAKLVKRSDGNYDLTDGVIAGRWAVNDMLRSIADLTINNGPLCDYLAGSAYQFVNQQVCGARDVTANGVDDDTASCDALSVAVAFDAVAAQVGGSPVPFPKSTTPCSDAALCGD